MMQASRQSFKVQVCAPKNAEHRRGMRWFSAITRAAQTELTECPDAKMNLQHAVQFYGVYAESGENEYLDLCEDFLQYALS